MKGGAELLANTQKAYFENHLANLPYLQLSQTTVLEDLVDIAQNADIQFQMSCSQHNNRKKICACTLSDLIKSKGPARGTGPNDLLTVFCL